MLINFLCHHTTTAHIWVIMRFCKIASKSENTTSRMQNLHAFPVIPWQSNILHKSIFGNYMKKYRTEMQGLIFHNRLVGEHSSEATWEIITQALLPLSTKNLQRKVQPVLLILGQSAFAEVHFCISEHTNSSACSNSVSLSLPPSLCLSLSGSSWQRPSSSTVWSPVFSLIWVVKVRLLEAVYFTSPTKKNIFFFVFSFPQMTNPKNWAVPTLGVKAAAASYFKVWF